MGVLADLLAALFLLAAAGGEGEGEGEAVGAIFVEDVFREDVFIEDVFALFAEPRGALSGAVFWAEAFLAAMTITLIK